MEEKGFFRSGACCVNTELECLPCFFRQIRRTLGYAGVNGDKGREISRQAERIIERASLRQAPARISTLLHRLIREACSNDPYKAIKSRYNKIALEQLPAVRNRIRKRNDTLEGSVRAAIAGNIIDFGIYDSVDLERSIDDSFRLPFSGTTYDSFSHFIEQASSVLYLTDNAGEIVFDRVLIDALRQRGKKVTVAVKGTPVINDATTDDAVEAGLLGAVDRIIDNGNDGIGTLLESCSSEFMEVYRSAEVIISKGQANFETLVSENDVRLFFLFMVKCPVVAASLGQVPGDIVLLQGGGNDRKE